MKGENEQIHMLSWSGVVWNSQKINQVWFGLVSNKQRINIFDLVEFNC